MGGYPSDLTDPEWALIAGFFDRPDPRGNPGKYAKREVVNAILYVVKGGIPWRMLPLDFPLGIPSMTITDAGISVACGNKPWTR